MCSSLDDRQTSLPLVLEDGDVDPSTSMFLCSYCLVVLWVALQVTYIDRQI